ncbi:hypothetical protein DYB25_001463 [Aphanomyces astaci]|uniref:Origin recognition complex subunit 5 C-terminal domain-containing protein n=1 Tax=Aphanomyces astaci TaxID=112090 RepID=A0A396ZV37_APHAT|nr:hypothetical protein DYB25_001463 [Aphanomyces astaci]RHY72704.1 hypothetical protein DYB34_003688 [Aphanomyces astaci]
MLGRDAQLTSLVALLGGQVEDDPFLPMTCMSMVPLVVVYGYNSTGKSSLVRLALQTLQRTSSIAFTAFVDCTTPDELSASFQLQPAVDGYHNLTFLGFLQCLTKIARNKGLVVAVDNVDQLLTRGMADLLSSLLRLPHELHVSVRLSFVLVTRNISSRLDKLLSPHTPAFVHLPLYTPDDVADILVLQLRMWRRETPFRAWIQFLHGLFEHDCHDWIDFRYRVLELLPLFDAQYDPEDATNHGTSVHQRPSLDKDHHSLDKDHHSPSTTCIPHLVLCTVDKAAHKSLVQQTQSRVKAQWNHTTALPSATTTPASISCSVPDTAKPIAGKHPVHHDDASHRVNLPRGSLLLVLASYLASFNPQESDMAFFTTATRQNKKRGRSTATSSSAPPSSSVRGGVLPPQLIGPKAFPLQRLLAIYYSIHDEVDPSTTFDSESRVDSRPMSRREAFAQIGMLVRMRVLQRLSPRDELDDIKLRCLADYDFVERIATQLEFPIHNFLNR